MKISLSTVSQVFQAVAVLIQELEALVSEHDATPTQPSAPSPTASSTPAK